MGMFKIGDYVTHRKFGVGQIIEVNTEDEMYLVSFCETGMHRVKFTTKMDARENDDYEFTYIDRTDSLSLKLISLCGNIIIREDFSIKRYKELRDESNVILHKGKEYRLLQYEVYSEFSESRVISERFCLAHKYSPCIRVKFRYADNEFFQNISDNKRDFPLMMHSMEDEESFKYNVREKYGIEL